MTQAAQALAPHVVVGERFELIRKLETGGMATIWVARHLTLDAEVAVKFIDEQLLERPQMRERFAQEARAAASIRSRYVVQILDYDEGRNGPPYIAMELLQGEHLASRLSRGPLSLAEAHRVVSQACRGLGKAHALGIIHRDIKPENLFLCTEEDSDRITVKLLDFGVAKFATGAMTRTASGVMLGTPVYMSPEQATARAVDHRADLYALATVVYHALTGAPPFDGRTLPSLVKAILEDRPPPLHLSRPDVPEQLEVWFERALAKKPGDRYSTAGEMAEAFLFLAGLSGELSLDVPRSNSGSFRYARFTLPSTPPDERNFEPLPRSGVGDTLARLQLAHTLASSEPNAPILIEAPRPAQPPSQTEPGGETGWLDVTPAFSARGTLMSLPNEARADSGPTETSQQAVEPKPTSRQQEPPAPVAPPTPQDAPEPSRRGIVVPTWLVIAVVVLLTFLAAMLAAVMAR